MSIYSLQGGINKDNFSIKENIREKETKKRCQRFEDRTKERYETEME